MDLWTLIPASASAVLNARRNEWKSTGRVSAVSKYSGSAGLGARGRSRAPDGVGRGALRGRDAHRAGHELLELAIGQDGALLSGLADLRHPHARDGVEAIALSVVPSE